MRLVEEYADARRVERIARLRRGIALRAMVASGLSQREIATQLGVSQPAVSQQLAIGRDLKDVHPEVLLEAAAPVLKALAAAHGFTRLAAFGSVARHTATAESDLDLIVHAPQGTSSFGFIRFNQLLEEVLGRPVDLVSYGGLDDSIDDDIRGAALL